MHNYFLSKIILLIIYIYKMYNNYNNYNNRSLFSSNNNYKLPNFEWQKRTEIKNDFNNELVKGFSQGLNLYNPEKDLTLFNSVDLDPIRSSNVNFDKLNQIIEGNYNKNDDIYNNAKAVISGVVDQVNKTTNDTVDNLKNIFNIDLTSIKIYGGLILLFILLNRN